MVAKKLDWRHATDYEFTESLDRAGWCWEFLRRNSNYRSDYAAMLDSFSDMHKSSSFLRSSQDVVERGPAILTAEEALGAKWGMSRAVDPAGDSHPEFRLLYPKELDWDSVQAYYEAESDEAPISIVAPFSILAFELSSDIDAQIDVAREFLSRRSYTDDDKTAMRRIKSQWTTYLRLLDAGPNVETKEIINHVEYYHNIENIVETGYRATDSVSDHRQAARRLCDEPLLILGMQVKDFPI